MTSLVSSCDRSPQSTATEFVAKAQNEKSGILQVTLSQMPKELIGIIRSYVNEGVYGPEEWKNWKNVDVLDDVPPAPNCDLSKMDKILLYIPRKVSFNSQEQDLTLKALKTISGGPFHFSNDIGQIFEDHIAPGWVLIDKSVIPESRGKDYETQKKMVERRGCRLPNVLEAIVLNLMVFDFTGERSYGQEPWTYTHCAQTVCRQYPVFVGGFSSKGLHVGYYSWFVSSHSDYVGVAGAQSKFSVECFMPKNSSEISSVSSNSSSVSSASTTVSQSKNYFQLVLSRNNVSTFSYDSKDTVWDVVSLVERKFGFDLGGFSLHFHGEQLEYMHSTLEELFSNDNLSTRAIFVKYYDYTIYK